MPPKGTSADGDVGLWMEARELACSSVRGVIAGHRYVLWGAFTLITGILGGTRFSGDCVSGGDLA